MSKLEELIAELCPDGVIFHTVKDLTKKKIVKVITPSIKITRNDYKKTGNTPIISQELEYISGYCEFIDNNIPENNYVCFGDHSEHIKYVNFAFVQGADGLKIMSVNGKKLIAKYFFYAISSAYVRHNNYERHFKYLNDTEIPIPPLEVQREIVRILDNFTELTAELTAELQARKKQYEYYRKHLLSSINNKISLKEIIKKSCSGGTPKKGVAEYYENGTIPWIRSQDVCFNEIHEVKSFITEIAVKKTSAKWIPENCVIVAISGATAGRCAINKLRTTTNQHCLNLEIDESKALYKYVYYCVCTQYDELIKKKQGARGDLNSSLVLGLEIPVPELKRQAEIVRLLDNFDSICTNLYSGLPAEIEARQKQYEYYRDKLLTFPVCRQAEDR